MRARGSWQRMSNHVLSYYLRKIRGKCLWCCCGSRKEVDLCCVEACSLYSYRRSSVDGYGTCDLLEVIGAARDKCIECGADVFAPCPIEDCPLIVVLKELLVQENKQNKRCV